MIFSRSNEKFATRLSINNTVLERKHASKILGVWISDDLSWTRNCQEICKKAYSRLSMLTKLKYVGVKIEDLVDIYILFIRSISEYCSVAYHSSLTGEQSRTLERIQKTCLKVILGEMFIDYPSALEMIGLDTLYNSLKSVKHDRNSRLFPTNNVRIREKFHCHIYL